MREKCILFYFTLFIFGLYINTVLSFMFFIFILCLSIVD